MISHQRIKYPMRHSHLFGCDGMIRMTLESRIDHLEGRMVPHTQEKSDKNKY
jgi:hypothetical protein